MVESVRRRLITWRVAASEASAVGEGERESPEREKGPEGATGPERERGLNLEPFPRRRTARGGRGASFFFFFIAL